MTVPMRMVMVMRVVMTTRGMIMVMPMHGFVSRIKDMNPPAMALIIMGMVNMAVAVGARLGLKAFVHLGH